MMKSNLSSRTLSKVTNFAEHLLKVSTFVRIDDVFLNRNKV